MTSGDAKTKEAIIRLADGTVKQTNLLSGTEVWTVPGRSERPLPNFLPESHPLDPAEAGSYCVFCEDRYLDTPPEISRVIYEGEHPKTLTGLPAEELFATTAEFRRIPNLFEIVSYNYWHLNHEHSPSEAQHRRMAAYLASDAGYNHVMSVVKTRLLAGGVSEEEFAQLQDPEKLRIATGFFAGGHDLIVPRRHFVRGATNSSQLAGSGSLSPEEHYQYMNLTVKSMESLYGLNDQVKFVVAFQNWLKPAGASIDHLHKQLVAIDQLPVQAVNETERLRQDPTIYEQILKVGVTRNLLIAQNDYAIALAGFGHRYPTVAIWPLQAPYAPWEATEEQLRGVSDIVHAAHAATGSQVPTNEEWYYQAPSSPVPMRWRLLLKWRISTLAGFEGGTGINLNTIDPWQIASQMTSRLEQLRNEGRIAPMLVGNECKVSPDQLI